MPLLSLLKVAAAIIIVIATAIYNSHITYVIMPPCHSFHIFCHILRHALYIIVAHHYYTAITYYFSCLLPPAVGILRRRHHIVERHTIIAHSRRLRHCLCHTRHYYAYVIFSYAPFHTPYTPLRRCHCEPRFRLCHTLPYTPLRA